MRLVHGLLVVGLGTLTASMQAFPATAKAPAPQEERKGEAVTLDGLQSRVPGDWVEERTTSRMRVKQFRLAPVQDDKDNTEVIIFYFGQGQGGTAQDNIKRWKKMFVPPEGKSIDEVTKVDTLKVGKVQMTYADLRGTYLYRPSPQAPDSEVVRMANHRMLAVVFESEKGPYFIRMVGPADTVQHYKKGFDDWLKGFK
jgi:hypothetical protein